MTNDAAPLPGTGTTQPVVLSGRDRALLVAVGAGRCQLSAGPLPTLLIDGSGACDQLAVYQLLAHGLIGPVKPRSDGPARAEPVGVELTPAGEAALGRVPRAAGSSAGWSR